MCATHPHCACGRFQADLSDKQVAGDRKGPDLRHRSQNRRETRAREDAASKSNPWLTSFIKKGGIFEKRALEIKKHGDRNKNLTEGLENEVEGSPQHYKKDKGGGQTGPELPGF